MIGNMGYVPDHTQTQAPDANWSLTPGTDFTTFSPLNFTTVDLNSTLAFGNGTSDPNKEETPTGILVLKSIAMVMVMASAVFGNVLTILAVFKVSRLRIIANSFIVSLAFADLLVAIVVMPFNASQEIAGKWVFGRLMCDIFNANDVLFSTASLLHICCISMDRYIAIMDPFHYETKMTKRRAAIMLCCVWGASALISHIPIQLGWYTTEKQQEILIQNQDQCTFVVNKIYAAISSCISFWIPSSIMVFTYVMIYREARRQEKQIHAMTHMAGHSMEHLNKVGNGHMDRNRNGSSYNTENVRLSQDRRKMKREHKAAKTLGIIMGAFLFCWLPFFLWYVITTMCGDEKCPTPPVLVGILFWIGYFNSALNPLIYAFFNRDFRNAFKKLLTNQQCTQCCDEYCSKDRWGSNFHCCVKRENGPETDALKSNFGTEMQHRASTSVSRSGQNTPSPIKRPPHYEN